MPGRKLNVFWQEMNAFCILFHTPPYTEMILIPEHVCKSLKSFSIFFSII